MSVSSYRSRGSLAMYTSEPGGGGLPTHPAGTRMWCQSTARRDPPPGSTTPSCWHPPGGGPPYRLCPFTCTRSMPVSLTQASRAILLVRLMLLVHC